MCGGGKLIHHMLPDGKYLTGFIVREETGHYFINTTGGGDFHDLDFNLRAVSATYFSFGGSKEEVINQIRLLNRQCDLPGYNPIKEILLRKKAA